MLIVLEGCDGTGKTTLAQNLALIFNAEVIHCTQETPNDIKFFADIIRQGSTRNIICDRFMYGQFVYQDDQERKRRGWLDIGSLKTLEHGLLATNAKVYHVVADEVILGSRLKARGEKVINGMTIGQVINAFRTVMRSAVCPIMEIDTAQPKWKGKVLTDGIIGWNAPQLHV